MSTDGESHRPKLLTFMFLVVVLLLVLLFDHGLLEQIRDLLSLGRAPTLAAFTRLVAYFVAGYGTAKFVHKHPGWLIACASAVSFILAALWLSAV